jgi:hypothetical protein
MSHHLELDLVEGCDSQATTPSYDKPRQPSPSEECCCFFNLSQDQGESESPSACPSPSDQLLGEQEEFGQLIQAQEEEAPGYEARQCPALDTSNLAQDEVESRLSEPKTPESAESPHNFLILNRRLEDVPIRIIEQFPVYYWFGMEDDLAEEGFGLPVSWTDLNPEIHYRDWWY